MKLETNTSKHTTTITKAADFGIDDADLSHIMGILRSQIYSDKLMAVIREYSTNATDANIEADIPNHPIEVHLPSIAEPYISFRDFGPGLTDEKVTTLYTKYGASTKRSSNDYTGCLGIGCKAGFAYGDNFQVITYRPDGIKTWLARIDESKKGTMSLIATVPNNSNKTGTEVSVSILRKDIEDCVSKARKLYSHWQIQPKCNQSLPKLDIIEDNKEWSIVKTDKAAYYSHRKGANVIMGNIVYPIDKSQISDNTGLLQHECVLIKAPVGALDVAANRESLEYTNRTKDSLIAMVNNILSDCILSLNKSIKDAPTRIQASINASKYDDAFGHQVLTKIKSASKWKNLPLITNIRFHNDRTVCHSMNQVWSNNTTKTYRNKRDKAVRGMQLKTNATICVWDDSSYVETNATRRVRTLQAQNNDVNNAEYFVIPKSCVHKVEPQLTADDYTNLDTITPLKANRTTITTTVNGNAKKVRVNVCTLQPHSLKSKRVSAETEPIRDKVNDCYIFVPLDRFDWIDKPTALDNLSLILESLETMLGYKPVINGVKKHHVSKLSSDWITLDKFFQRIFKQFKAKHPKEIDTAEKLTSSNYTSMGWTLQFNHIIECCNNTQLSEFAKVNRYTLRLGSFGTMEKYKNICQTGYLIQAMDRSNWWDTAVDYIKSNHIILFLCKSNFLELNKSEAEQLLKEINKQVS